MNQTNKTEKFGIHVMIDGYKACPRLLNDREHLLQLLFSFPENLGMYRICEPQLVEVGPNNHKDPGGLSGFVMIAESHISFHTFPNRGFVTIDVYTCQNDLDCDRVVTFVNDAFKFESVDVFIQDRGLRYPLENLYAL